MRDTCKIGHPVFILCVLTLILNDWYLKTAFHNELTGKLSDFAGLFAFPFLLSALFPVYKRKIHLWTVVLFLFWKSEYAQFFISMVQNAGIPIYRTADLSDHIALLSIPLSYWVLDQKTTFLLKPFFQGLLIVISCFAFMATSVPSRVNRKYTAIDKQYQFDFSKNELVSRLNIVQLNEIRKLNKLRRGEIDFDSQSNVFHYHGQPDTLALILDNEKVNDQDTIVLRTSFAEITLSGNDSSSVLTLVNVYKSVPVFKDKDYRDKAIAEFEKHVIKKIR